LHPRIRRLAIYGGVVHNDQGDKKNPLAEEASNLLLEEYRKINESRLIDLWFESYLPEEKEWFLMASTRAPSLFRTCIGTGAILGGASKNLLSLLYEYAENIGYAFDIQDDIIGTFAPAKIYGRPPTGDLRLGKKTLFIIKAVEREKELLKILGRGVNGTALHRARFLIKKSGGLEEAKRISADYTNRAKEIMKRCELGKESKDFFLKLADFILSSMEWYV
jgi:geranylgeranyl pyrophosphate synthase